jgi:hypothetical protein
VLPVASAYRPGAQSWHSVAFVKAEAWPVGQDVQLVRPVLSVKKPCDGTSIRRITCAQHCSHRRAGYAGHAASALSVEARRAEWAFSGVRQG